VEEMGVVGGATEKDVLEDPETGSRYIAKLGRRNSDLEVITEYAIYLIGRTLDVNVADAMVARFRGRLRFLSRYFLDAARGDELVHGVQLFRELYDETTVAKVLGSKVREQEMFSVQSVKAAFGAHYGSFQEELLFEEFVAMLTHDALLGVQDRHHENWGVIVSRTVDGHAPRFAPLYDSARGLFCNETDAGLLARKAWHDGMPWLGKYIRQSRPLVGFVGIRPENHRRQHLTHVELLAAVFREYPAQRRRILLILQGYDWRRAFDGLRYHLSDYCSPRRRDLILTCLRRRQRALLQALNVPTFSSDILG